MTKKNLKKIAAKIAKMAEKELTKSRGTEISLTYIDIKDRGFLFLTLGVVSDTSLRFKRSRSVRKLLRGSIIIPVTSLRYIFWAVVSERFFFVLCIKSACY